MKLVLSVYFGLFLTASFFGTSAMAAKQCFGVGADKGDRFELTLSSDEAMIQNFAGINDALVGRYRRDQQAQPVQGKFGNSYLIYESRPMTTLLVDQELLNFGRTGIAKIVAKGEPGNTKSFFCHED